MAAGVRRRNQIVRRLAQGILKDQASTLQSVSNNVHLDDNVIVTLKDIRDVERHLKDVKELLSNYHDNPSDTIKRLLDLED